MRFTEPFTPPRHRPNASRAVRERPRPLGLPPTKAFVCITLHRGQAPEIDGQVYLSGGDVLPGQMRRVTITQASDYDLVGEVRDADAPASNGPTPKKRVRLNVIGAPPRAYQ